MKRLIIIISSMSFGGAEIQTLEVANGLVDRGFDIDIIVLDSMNYSVSRADKRINFHFMNKQSFIDFKAIKKIRTLLYDINPNSIFLVDLYPTMYFNLAIFPKKPKKNTVTVIHSTLPRDNKEKLQRKIQLPFLKRIGNIVFVSSNQMDYWIKNYKLDEKKSLFIHNGVDIEKFSIYLSDEEKILITKEELGIENSHIIIGNCSRFRVEKRQKDIIEAVKILKEKGYKIKLLMVGDGEMRESLEEQIKKYELEKDVIITGYIEDVRPYVALMDIFVLSSDSVETLSIAAIESLAMKKATVLSDIGGASEIVVDGMNGYRYQPKDYYELATKLETMIKEGKYKEMGEKGYLHALKYFQRGKMVSDYEKIFEKPH
ncbi:glycosyltransferase involved in cell wall biosynthesis [Acetoanaerobium pronyense]|uniref:Glycosyltransferase involved in cell wall biosynthesis n=1 Tax=Acetoanaerobium pronyense TaxID=1482736 RepID=A0ABS4KHI3_9FIRM|nr:glycosyltransferase family 4 protein [Acetoanaerobium pronyense]MBP2027203.1 glycosyltransferase involved in cell wall biosynthesis [Acetoanaerobium pronyense]